MNQHELFLKSISEKKIVRIEFNSHEKGVIIRRCIPFDFGPSRRFNDGIDRYHFYDLESADGAHNLSIVPQQLLSIEVLDSVFEPGDYVTWKPAWFVARDWGVYS